MRFLILLTIISISLISVVNPLSTPPKPPRSFDPAFRKEVLTRTSPHFELNKQTGSISFGSTIKLTTTLTSTPSQPLINSWLNDIPSISKSIWDPTLIHPLPPPTPTASP
ncbi:hypothetical protein TL16_g08958 [Triparma laevis f. inornata]|uniref:Uncharacterized protein n=1 Tax=Triparma laevis f. inornata TaxID=1714386 RepID=A0A9W7B3N7_9STRA|nr:hypothetical protein TL16_g08958 [Triparma laevis f. inornata]